MITRQSIFEYVKARYGTQPDYPWKSHPGYAVLRHDDTRKWYAVVMEVDSAVLGPGREGRTDVINVKVAGDAHDFFRNLSGIYPAYHMDKTRWLSLCLDAVPEGIVLDLLDQSFALTGEKRPSRKLYISDLHFYHESLNGRMDRRGFSDAGEMNRAMIERWNQHVTAKDEVYILGDLSVGKGPATNEIVRQLNGKLFLISGNHDKFLQDKKFDASAFGWIKPYAELKDNRRKVILCHYPVFCYNGQNRLDEEGRPKTYMLYGHLHNTLDEKLVSMFQEQTRAYSRQVRGEDKPIPCNMINCFCMFSNYVPLALDEWIQVQKAREAEKGAL